MTRPRAAKAKRDPAITTAAIRRALHAEADPASVPVLQKFFKTGPGQYGAGDVFIGVRVPRTRAICRQFRGAPLDQIEPLLQSRVHEERLLALLLVVDGFGRAGDRGRRKIFDFYLAHTAWINNWDLVDSSAPQVVGEWLRTRSRRRLRTLARSASLWERRIAIMATFPFIRHQEYDDTFAISDLLMADQHDLIHKAVGWMLREVGNRDPQAERRYLKDRYTRMPRTMLRYAIEKFPERERRQYLRGAL